MLAIFQSVGLASTVLAAVLVAVLPRATPAVARARRPAAAKKATSGATNVNWGQLQAR
jgi:hypothetical protein